MKRLIVGAWAFIFDRNVSPLRHIPDLGTRHLVFQLLGGTWAVAFAVAIGNYAMLPASLIGHAALIAAAAVTVASYATAATKPEVFTRILGRRHDGEHE